MVMPKDDWMGKTRRVVEFSCWECGTHDYVPSISRGREYGWVRIKTKWHCHQCAAKANEAPVAETGT